MQLIRLVANPTDVKFHMDRDQVAKCAQQCNMKKRELTRCFIGVLSLNALL